MYTANGRKYFGVRYSFQGTYRAVINYKSRRIQIGYFQLACDAAAHVDKVLDIARESRRIRNFQTREEYHKERKEEIISRANEYYDSFTDEQKKILSKKDLKLKLLEISKDNRKPMTYLLSKLLGEDCSSYANTTFIGSYLDRQFGKYYWTPAETSQLMQLVKQHGTKDWKKIASEMKTKSIKQCRDKYKPIKSKLRRRKKGVKAKNRWTDAEESKLDSLVKKYGNKWDKIAKEIGKTQSSCRTKFWNMNKITPNKQEMKMKSVPKKKAWTDAEIAKLERLLKKYGTNWKKIAQELSRTETSVKGKLYLMENSK